MVIRTGHDATRTKIFDLDKEHVFNNNFMVGLQTPVLSGGATVAYLIIYLINPKKNPATPGDRDTENGIYAWNTRFFRDNLDRMVITDTEGKVLWSLRKWCISEKLACYGKDLSYKSDILDLLEVKEITIEHIPNNHKARISADLKRGAASLEAGGREADIHVAKKAVIDAQKLAERSANAVETGIAALGDNSARTKGQVKDPKTLAEFVIYLIYTYLDPAKKLGISDLYELIEHPKKILSTLVTVLKKVAFLPVSALARKNQRADITAVVSQTQLTLGETVIIPADLHFFKDLSGGSRTHIDNILNNNYFFRNARQLKTVPIFTPSVAVVAPVAAVPFGRKQALRRMPGVSFKNGSFSKFGRKITVGSAFRSYVGGR